VIRRCLCFALAAFAGAAHSQTYPVRPIRAIMTVAGGADIIARLVAHGLTASLGQPVVVETQSGAGGAIGTEAVARARNRLQVLKRCPSCAVLVSPYDVVGTHHFVFLVLQDVAVIDIAELLPAAGIRAGR